MSGLRINTPVEDHLEQFGLLVKREDLSCPPPGPPFSKTRGVFAHIAKRPEKIIGVLDTYHSQGGQAVAYACSLLGKSCVNFYPVRKADRGADLQPQQIAAQDMGAKLLPLPAGRSAILYHQAKKLLPAWGAYGADTYMMPNALKLPEMVEETAEEVTRTLRHRPIPRNMPVIVSASSGTIAAGVIRGFWAAGLMGMRPFIIHQGYDRSATAILGYMADMGFQDMLAAPNIVLVNEGYSYGDVAKAGPDPLWPCNRFYDLKAFRWWMREGRDQYGEAMLWNIG